MPGRTSADVSAIFFMKNEEDVLIIDLEQIFNLNLFNGSEMIPTDVEMTVTTSEDLSDEMLEYLESYILINSFHLKPENGTLGTFYTYLHNQDPNKYSNASLIYTIKMLKAIPKDLQLNLDFKITLDGSDVRTYKSILYLDDNLSSKQELAKDSGNCIDTDSASFMLAYTNPRLTGNIKLVVDTDYNLYLDTFKASRILCNNNYRHQPISYEGNYAHDVYMIFNSLPKGEIYKVNSDAYDPHKVYTNYDNQYWTMYQYGAETNDDFLYSENMKILAPLYIKRSLPDFFAIFRVDEYFNQETYETTLNDYEKFEHLLRDGKIVQIYDLRKYTSIGQYLNNYAESIADVASPIFLQFQEQDRDENDLRAKYKNGTNIWTGISLDKGVIVNKSETTYFSNKILNENKFIQEDFNMFLIDGFQRNNILYPNIINLEFMFNDEESETYSMHKYFGLYLKENQIERFAGAVKETLLSNIYTLYDDSWKVDSSIESFIEDATAEEYKDRIVFGVTPTNASRITNYDDYKDFVFENVINKPYTNEINIAGNKVLKEDEGYKSFISMKFEEPIKYGEHFRFIIKHHFNADTKKYKNIILELIASNDVRLAHSKDNISPYILTNHTFGNGVISDGYMFRTSSELTSQSGYFNEDNKWVTPLLRDSEYFKATDTQNIYDYSFTNLVIGGDDALYKTIQDDTYFSSVFVENANVYKGNLTVKLYGLSQEMKDEYPEIYRLAFYTQDVNDHDTVAPIEEQLARIRACIRKFNYTIFTGDVSDDRISFITSEEEVYFQHIASDILNIDLKFDETNSIDYYADYPKENIKYFNTAIDFYYKPLSFNTKFYTNEELIFALFDFEILGSRLGTIIKFANFMPNQYEIDSSIVADKTYNKLLSLTANGYYPINEYEIKSVFPYVADTNVNNNFYKNELKDNGSINENVVISPFNTQKAMISSKLPMVFTHFVKLWNVMPFNISLMGIHNIAAIDSKINYNATKRVSSEKYLTASAGERLLLDGTVGNLQKYTLYKFVSGKFENCPLSQGSVFYITSDNEVVYLNGTALEIETIAADYLIVYEDVKIENVIDKNYPNYDFTTSLPSFSNLAFYKDSDDIQNSDLKVPLAYPLIAQFKADAVYYDNNNILNVKEIKDREYQSRLSNSDYAINAGFFNTKENNMADTLSSTVTIDGELHTFKDIIINKLANNAIRNFLLYSNNLETCKAKYNKYTNTLEFIYYGIKFKFTFQNTDYASSIRLNEYNNYEVCVINEYDKTKNNEIFISTIENIILIINHKFKITENENSKSNIIIENDSVLTNTITYTWDTLPYNLDFTKVIANSNYLILNKINKTFDFKLSDDILSIVELDYLNPDREEYDINYYAYFPKCDSLVDETNYLKLLYYPKNEQDECVNLCTCIENSLESNIDDVIEPVVVNTNASVYFDDNNEYASLNTYYVSKNSSNNKKLIDNIFEEYEASMSDDCDLYIIRQKDTVLEQINDSYRPLTFSFITPNKIKFNYGYFDISYENLLSFKKEDSITSSISNKYVLANTKINSVDKLKNIIGNKVFSKIISNEVKINYFIEPQRSLLASSWDNGYYRLYSNSENYVRTNGYTTGIEDKAFFGSKCIVLNDDYLNIENWKINNNIIKVEYSDSNYNIHSENKNTLVLTINLTKAVYDYFSKDCEKFIDNWKAVTGFYSSVYLNNFIKLTLMKYFKLDDANAFELYEYINPTYSISANLVYKKPDDLEKYWKKVENFKSEYINNNDEIVLKIYIPNYKNKTFYPKYTLSRNK